MELLIEGTALGYFPADRLVQIQPADGSTPGGTVQFRQGRQRGFQPASGKAVPGCPG